MSRTRCSGEWLLASPSPSEPPGLATRVSRPPRAHDQHPRHTAGGVETEGLAAAARPRCQPSDLGMGKKAG